MPSSEFFSSSQNPDHLTVNCSESLQRLILICILRTVRSGTNISAPTLFPYPPLLCSVPPPRRRSTPSPLLILLLLLFRRQLCHTLKCLCCPPTPPFLTTPRPISCRPRSCLPRPISCPRSCLHMIFRLQRSP